MGLSVLWRLFMSILLRYFMIIVACIALLLGMQLPGLADQYAKRIDAHLREVTLNFLPYQDVANANTQGNIERLIDIHRKSEVKLFQDEAGAIERMYKRKLHFEVEAQAMKVSLPERLVHIVLQGDREILRETVNQFSATVPLNEEALIMGGGAALTLLLLIELLLQLLRRLGQAAARWLNHRWHGA
jgi:Protein of unknown function (DUF2937)